MGGVVAKYEEPGDGEAHGQPEEWDRPPLRGQHEQREWSDVEDCALRESQPRLGVGLLVARGRDHRPDVVERSLALTRQGLGRGGVHCRNGTRPTDR